MVRISNPLDVAFFTDSQAKQYMVQHSAEGDIWDADSLRMLLRNPDVIATLTEWQYRIDNAGRLDTILRELGYTAQWSDVQEYPDHMGRWWLKLVDIKHPETTFVNKEYGYE
jgi:hypothetical protein